MEKRTKIVCTLGPSSESIEKITEMVNAGMNVARLNFSHGTHKNHDLLIQNIRKVEQNTKKPIAIMQDLQGPKIRIGLLPEKGVELKEGTVVSFDTSQTEYKDNILPIDYDLHEYAKIGERILLDDGDIEVKITHINKTRIDGEIVVGGILTSHKGINVPDSKLSVSALTEKDKEDARFGVKSGVEFIALSFVNNAKDILDLRYLVKEYEKEMNLKSKEPIRIIAKIERGEAVNNIKEILDVADGIMVARGDLGIEIPAQQVPLAQKNLINLAMDAEKPVIVATQMLSSMKEKPRPTRAEVSDIANAVIDHADAIMLSNETATGKYPIKSVQTMTDIILETESSTYDDLPLKEHNEKKHEVDDIVSSLSRLLAERVGAKIILTASISGDTGRLLSRYRPELPILVGTGTDRVLRQLNLSWGVIPFLLEPCNSIEELVERSIVKLKKREIITDGDKMIVVAGEPVGHVGNINLLEVRDV